MGDILHHGGESWVRLAWFQIRGEELNGLDKEIERLTAQRDELLGLCKRWYLDADGSKLDGVDLELLTDTWAAINKAEGE